MMDTTVGQVISPKGCAVLIGWLNALGKGLELLASTEKKPWLHWQGVGRGRVGRKRKGKKFLARSLSPDRKSQGGSFPFLYFCFKLMPVSLINGNREMKISSI